MKFTQIIVAGLSGAALPYSTVSVYLEGTTTKATLYDIDGGSISNPMTASATGLVGFKVANGIYDIECSGPNEETAPKILSLQIVDEIRVKRAGLSGTVTADPAYYEYEFTATGTLVVPVNFNGASLTNVQEGIARNRSSASIFVRDSTSTYKIEVPNNNDDQGGAGAIRFRADGTRLTFDGVL
jgi:hypothetical protein